MNEKPKPLIDMSDWMSRDEFRSESEYQGYLSACRESDMKVKLGRLWFRGKQEGLTCGEYVRALINELQEICRNQP